MRDEIFATIWKDLLNCFFKKIEGDTYMLQKIFCYVVDIQIVRKEGGQEQIRISYFVAKTDFFMFTIQRDKNFIQ